MGSLVLSAIEARVLGSLIEKAVTTPDYYPLSLNALTNACNQLTNRDPVMRLEEAEVSRAVDQLREKRLATSFHGAESRVPKFKHTLTDAILLTPAELALLAVLLLRGPQTVGELRTRTEKFFPFKSATEVEETLQALANRVPQPLVTKLPRQPGTKEPRHMHLFGDAVAAAAPTPTAPIAAPASEADRVTSLEQEVAALRSELDAMKQAFAELRRQLGS